MIHKSTKGISRNKYSTFVNFKRQTQPKKSRFSKENYSYFAPLKSPLIQIEMTANQKNHFFDEPSTAGTIDSVPPGWITTYQECQSLIQAVDDIRAEMSKCQNQRLTVFKQEQQVQLEMRIYEYAKEATRKIKQCEKKLVYIKNNQHSSASDQKTCDNICFKLSLSLQQATKKIRHQQKSFIQQRKQYEQTQRATFLQVAADKMLNWQYDYDQLNEQQVEIQDLQSRNKEIKLIVQSIYELNDLFKELSAMVILQGSLLDRIDLNITESYTKVKEGTQTLVRAEKIQKKTSRCACVVILVILVIIGIIGIVLFVRWSKY